MEVSDPKSCLAVSNPRHAVELTTFDLPSAFRSSTDPILELARTTIISPAEREGRNLPS